MTDRKKQIYVTTSDSIQIAIQESGDPTGPELLFIHGLLGSHLNLAGQFPFDP
jgi:pimeloyl-ACP methyl ester carboxylesterase